MDSAKLIEYITCAKKCSKFQLNKAMAATYSLDNIVNIRAYFEHHFNALFYCNNYISAHDDHDSCINWHNKEADANYLFAD